jgi:hypothetical protein
MARYLKRGATYEATAPLNSDDPLLSDLENGGGSSYVALLTQSGTDAPTATVLENSTGETPSLAYESEGNYDLVFAQTLDEDATSILIQSLTSLTSNVCAYWLDANTIRISTLNGGGSFTDGLLSKTTIQIKIY